MTSSAVLDAEKIRSIAVRSLRRRLWQSFLSEDRAAAVRWYTCTVEDWKTVVRQEELEKERLLAENTKKAGGKFRIRRRSHASQHGKRSISGSADGSHSEPFGLTTTRWEKASLSSSPGLLQQYMNPSEPFTEDDFKLPDDCYDEGEEEKPTTREKKPPNSGHRRTRSVARQAVRASFFLRRRSSRNNHFRYPPSGDSTLEEEEATTPAERRRNTTPLHEACRLGSAELVRLMLAQERKADCNLRNGMGRTALHCVAGGWTAAEEEASEERKLAGKDVDEDLVVGIRAPPPVQTGESGPGQSKSRAQKAAIAVGRLFLRHPTEKKQESTASPTTVSNKERRSQLELERMDAALVVMAWTQPVDDSPGLVDHSVSLGISTNAVDSEWGRTALHYAAELGRSDICMAILSSFGTMLTIVDSQARTPCELAAAQGFDELAAKLEARALLYVDPYGTDEELLSSITANEGGGESSPGGVPPFAWFETCSMTDVQRRREHRIEETLEKMKQIAVKLQDSQNARRAVSEYAAGDEKPAAVKSDEQTEEEELDEFPGLHMLGSLDEDEVEFLGQKRRETAFVFLGDLGIFESLEKTHVERFLSFHHWDVKKALVTFYEHPCQALEKASVPFPRSCDIERSPCDPGMQAMCLICCEIFAVGSKEWKDLDCCEHGFCRECLGNYLIDCAKSKKSGVVVVCPHHECNQLLSPSEIAELCPSNSIHDMLLKNANENFVVCAEEFRFCPHPGCSGAVKFNAPSYAKTPQLAGSGLLELAGAVCTNVGGESADSAVTYEGVRDPHYYDPKSKVQPKKAHRFCFKCGELGIHWPITCDRLSEWKDAITETVKQVKGEGENVGCEDYNDVAQKLWMKANTRPCPKCKAPISKAEVCNHMTCCNPHCKHEFCWICRNDWKMHNTETGGFFRCNRWVDQKEHEFYDEPPEAPDPMILNPAENISDPRTMEVTYGTAMHETRAARKRSREMDRFLHHYDRWNAHAESAALERNMADMVCSRLTPVVDAAIDFNGSEYVFGGKGLSFIHDAFTELLECRSLLQHSYAFSYLRYKSIHPRKYKLLKRLASEKIAFEQFQSELELMTEQISDVVARSHIRATQTQITFLTTAAAEKRKEFSNIMINILVEEKKERDTESLQEKGDPPGEKGGDPIRRDFSDSFIDSIVGMASEIAATANQGSGRAESEESDDMQEAVRESLEEFLSATGAAELLEYGGDGGDLTLDWACSACTYVNAGGRHCTMCGTVRS